AREVGRQGRALSAVGQVDFVAGAADATAAAVFATPQVSIRDGQKFDVWQLVPGRGDGKTGRECPVQPSREPGPSAIRPRPAYQPTIPAGAAVFSDPLLGPLDRPVRRKVNRTGLETDDFLADAGADFGDHRIRIGWAEADHGSFHGGRPGAGPGAGLADNLAQLADQVFTSRDGREALREHHFG